MMRRRTIDDSPDASSLVVWDPHKPSVSSYHSDNYDYDDDSSYDIHSDDVLLHFHFHSMTTSPSYDSDLSAVASVPPSTPVPPPSDSSHPA